MTVSTLILSFEVAIAALLFLLCYQLVRQYRAFYKELNTTRTAVRASANQLGFADAATQRDFHNQNLSEAIQGQEPKSTETDNSVSVEEDLPLAQLAPEVEVNKPSKVILNDYIDGFFTDSSPVSAEQLDQFKAEAAPPIVTSQLTASKGEIVEDEEVAPPVLHPIFVEELQLEEEEDSFIVVNDSVSEILPGQESSPSEVMSDKVVHAMLKEAKSACS